MDGPLEEKMRAFLAGGTAESIASPRRIGREGFADMVQNILSEEHPEMKIIRIGDPEGEPLSLSQLTEIISGNLSPGKNAVMIVHPGYACHLSEISSLLKEGDALYSFQELCHQVCVCIKGLRGLEGGSCIRT